MIKEAINRILELAQIEQKEINGYIYTSKPMHMVKVPTPDPIKATTLTALVDYIKSSNTDVQIDGRALLIHVVSPWEIQLITSLRYDAEREHFFTCSAMIPNIPFGRFIQAEEFNIMMQSSFVDNDDKAVILQVIGNIQEENVATIGDDGVTQSVVAKTGVSTKSNVIVPNPVTLAPYRTFPEIKQPYSKFIFRMRQGAQAALFEADGGAWKNEAMQKIKEWLECELHTKHEIEEYEETCGKAPDPFQNITIIA